MSREYEASALRCPRAVFRVAATVPILIFGRLLSAQESGIPRWLCRQWDDAFLSTFHAGLATSMIVTFVLVVMSGLIVTIFPPAWMARRPWYRALLSAFVVWILGSLLLVPLGNRILSQIYAGVGPRYSQCVTMPFGAQGLFGGAIGKGTAALAQAPLLFSLLGAGCFAAAFLAWFGSRLVARRAASR